MFIDSEIQNLARFIFPIIELSEHFSVTPRIYGENRVIFIEIQNPVYIYFFNFLVKVDAFSITIIFDPYYFIIIV